MKRAVYGLVGLGMCLLSAPAFANLSLVNYDGFEVRQSGNTWEFGHASSESTRLRGGTVLPNASVSTSQRALAVSKTLPVGKGLPVDVVAKIPASAFAKAVVAGGKLLTPIGAVMTAVEIANYFKDIGLEDVKNTPNGLTAGGLPPNTSISDGYEYKTSYSDWTDPYSACEATIPNFFGQPQYWSVKEVTYNGGLAYQCIFQSDYPWGSNETRWMDLQYKRSSTCSPGDYITPSGCTSQKPVQQMTEQELIDKIASESGWPTSAARALQSALYNGAKVETETPTTSGPANIVGEKTTTTESVQLNPGTNTPAAPGSTNTQPGTKTTTKTTTTNAEYSGPNVNTKSTTTTVTNITNNITNITTTQTDTETKEDDQKQEEPPVDTPLGDIPELYKKKYPEGISGVVTLKIEELRATPLFRLPSLLMPNLPESGSCPSWQVDLSLSSWADMGTHTIEAPCMVWDFGKVIIIVSALLLARRLIFGG